MKFKTFILTFLMMMSSPFLFGHQTGANYDWDNVASLQDNAKMDTQFQIGDNSRGSSEVVAKIGENTYATLQGAFEAAAQATEATTITLLSNITIESNLNNAGSGYFNVADGKNVTLDLGGKKITATDNSTGNFILFYNYGEFTIKNGTVELTATNNRLWNAESAIVLNRGGIFNCESGTYTHKGGSDMSFVFDNSGNYYGDATMNIGVQQRSTDAPVLTSSYIAIRNRMEQNSHGASGEAILNVYGGTISGTSRAIWAQASSTSETAPATGEINVEGGNIGLIDTPRSTGAVSMTTISGGTVAAFKGEVGELQVVAPGEITGEITILTPGDEPADYIIDENGNYIEPTIINVDSQDALQSAINNSQSGDVITVNEDIELTSSITIPTGKYVILDLNGKTISMQDASGAGAYAIKNNGNLTIKDSAEGGKITFNSTTPDNNAVPGYSTSTIGNGGHLTIENGIIENTTVGGASYAIDGIWHTGEVSLTINDGTITAKKIAVRQVPFSATAKNTVTINGGTLTGEMAGLQMFNTSNNAMLSETVINGGVFNGTYGFYTSFTSAQGSNLATINIDGGVFNGYVFLYNGNNGSNAYPMTVAITDGIFNAGAYVYTKDNNGNEVPIKSISGGTFAYDPSEYCAEGYICEYDEETGTYGVVEDTNVAQIGETKYTSLQAAINAATVGQTVKVIRDINLTQTVTVAEGKDVILDLNGKTINTAWEDETAEKHYYAFDNKGTLTITDNSTEANGVINARGNFNYGTLTLEKGTINAIDHNGGYGVRNYEGSKFTMNGGLIATTNENGDAPVSGAYDATTVRVDNGAEFIMNGGKINNISNYTFAIDNYGTTTIKENAGEVKSVHTTLANYGTMTISAGTFICNGLEGVTAHALWADAGTTIINGGTFDGKDNYNGFNVCASAGAVVEINGGKFESVHSGSLYGDGTITVKGGTFFDNVSGRCAEGYAALPSLQNTFVVGETPTATVNNLGRMEIPAGDYMVYGGGTNTEEMPLSFVMQFLADQDAEDMATSPFAEWYGDFVITFTGIENGSFTANGCYLAGHYGSFGWVKVPVDGMTIEEGVRYPVMLGVGMGQNYSAICSSVQDFRCALYLTDEILAENPNIQVNLELAIVDNSKGEAAAANALVENENVYEVVDYDYDAIDFNTNFVARIGDTGYETLQEAINDVQDNQVIELLTHNSENIVAGNENQKPFNKIFTIDGGNFNVTGKWIFGRDDHNTDNSEITVKNVNFSVYGIKIDDFKSVTINECTFKNITEGNGIYVAADEFTSSIIVEDCEIENVAGAGINLRNPVNTTITGNSIKNTGNNAITFQHGTAYTEAENGTYIITNNVLENWAYNATEGRAIRIATGVEPRAMTIENNAMIKENAPEEFVKITGNTENVSIDKNYWNGANPVEEHTPAYYLVEGITPNSYYQNYSVENGLENLLPTQASVAQIGDYYYSTLEAAFEAVQTGETIIMIADAELETTITIPVEKTVILNLNGKKIAYTSTTQGEAMITNRGNLTINDGDSKDGMGEIYYNYTGAADPSYGKGNYTISNAGTLTVNGGKIHIANLRQHAKYPIDNNSGSGDAILVINGGHLYNYNTSAIRQFCNSTTNKNSVTINGGLIEGYSAIWMQNPGKNTVNGQLTINAGEIKTTAKAYVNGTSPISEVASKIYCTTEGGTWDEGSALIIEGGIISENVCLNNETPASVTLNKEATYNGSIRLDEGGQFVHNGLMNVTLSKDITGTPIDDNAGWYTISSPVGPVDHDKVDDLLNGTHDLYRYDEPTMMWENVKNNEHTDFTTLEAGRGYIYANTANTTLSFTGDLVVEAVEQNITATDNNLKGFNLVGNPFTHNITLDHISGANLAAGFYTLTNEGAWNANNSTTGVINALQGALIKTTETKKVQINPAVLSKSRSVNNGQLEINVSNANYNDVAYVTFNKGIGLDKIEHRNANIPMVYVPVNGTNYAVAIMSNDVTEIPVSFVAKTMGEYTISVEAQDCEFAQMYLIDKMTGYSTNLLLEDYTFIATSKDNADRFIIRLVNSFDHSFGAENFVIFSNDEMMINDIQGEGVIRIVDVLGRPVAEYNVFGSANISTTSFRSGAYMIQVIDESGVKVQKIIID